MQQKLIILILLLTLAVLTNVRKSLYAEVVNVHNNCGACDVATVALVCDSIPCGSGFVPYGKSSNFEVPTGSITIICSCNEGVKGHTERVYEITVHDDDMIIVTFKCGLNELIPWPCIILALYGEASEEVEALRLFRDTILSQSPEGLELIALYYQWSPVIMRAMEADEEFKEDIREMIDGVLGMVEGLYITKVTIDFIWNGI